MQTSRITNCLAVLLLFLSLAPAVHGAPTNRALIVCGLSGNEEFKQQYVQTITQIRTALLGTWGFEEENIRIQFGCGEEEKQVEAFPVVGRATREEIAAEGKRLSASDVKDNVWVFVLGQSYNDGKHVFLNLPDEDLHEQHFGKIFADLKSRSTFIISTPASGHFIKPLSRPNRVIMTSAAVAETNGSVFHIALGEAIQDISNDEEFDADKNGSVSLLDLYVKTVRNMTDIYYENDPPLIPTEHPLLDDNGDGQGSELQADYLPMAQGGRSDSKRKRRLRKFKDGKVAALVRLPLVPSK